MVSVYAKKENQHIRQTGPDGMNYPVRSAKAPVLSGAFLFMANYVHIIQSLADGSFYKGYSENPLQRLSRHNNKLSQYTSSKVSWKLVYIEFCESKTFALKREKALKKYSHSQIEQPKNFILNKSQYNVIL